MNTGTPLDQESSQEQTPEPWDSARLNEALEQAGLSGSKLSKKLVSRTGGPPSKLQVLRWRKGEEEIPTRYWSQLNEVFGGGK